MSNKTRDLTVEEQLLQARKENLDHVQQLSTLQANGKVLGMDAFSWLNPDIESLASWLVSIPFKVIWIGPRAHMEKVVEFNENIVGNLETLIVHDGFRMQFSDGQMLKIENIISVGDVGGSLELLRAFQKEQRMILFTSDKNNSIEEFKNYIKSF